MAGLRIFLGSILVVMVSAVSSAQVTFDPRSLEFAPSPDHDAIDSNGLPLIQRYELSVYDVSTSTQVNGVDLGKPQPSTDGMIHVDLVHILPAWPLPSGVMYEASVTATGASGSASSIASNTFEFSGPCVFSLSASSSSFGAAGGQGNVSVNAGSACQWSASSAAPWIAPTSISGFGAQTVTYTVSPNTSGTPRSGTLIFANIVFTIYQSGVACTFGVTANTVAFPDSGGSASANVIAPGGCGWTVSKSAAWITPDTSSSSGTQAVGYAVAANTSTTARTGSLTIAGTVVTISQAGATRTSLPTTTVVNPQRLEFNASAEHDRIDAGGQFLVQAYELAIYETPSNTLFSSVSLGKPAPDAAGIIHVNLSAYLVPLPPAGVTYEARVSAVGAGRASSAVSNPFEFTAPCTSVVSPNIASISASGGQGSLSVSSGIACTWSVSGVPPWITFGSQAGTGSQTLGYSVASNTSTTSRAATFSIANTLVTISQAGLACSFQVGAGTTSFGANGGSSSANVGTVTGCGWSASSPVPWVTLSGTTYAGSQSVGYTVAANTSPSPRATTLAIANVSLTISQSGASCGYMVASATNTFTASGGVGSVTVSTSTGCTWSVASSSAWISPAASTGSGSQTIAFSVAPNTSSSSRTGSITVAGAPVTVTQSPATAPTPSPTTCTFTLSRPSDFLEWKGGTRTVSLNTGASCRWTATHDGTWLTVTPGSGIGNGSITYTATKNMSALPRVATVVVGNQVLIVTEQGK